jgi:carbamoyl-phosphate synthase large subunit
MKSTGEVMGASDHFGEAFAKAWLGAGHRLPLSGTAFVSVNDRDKRATAPIARRLRELGFEVVATRGTADFLRGQGLEVGRVLKVHEGRPSIVDRLISREIDLVVNTPLGRESHEDDEMIRQTALKYDIPCITTLSGATAAVEGIASFQRSRMSVVSLQERYRTHGVGRPKLVEVATPPGTDA